MRRSAGSVMRSTLLTTLAGISSTRSAASSMFSASITDASSLSVRTPISRSCVSCSIYANTSAAGVFGSRRNSKSVCSSLRSSKSVAMSTAFISASMSRTRLNCRLSKSSSKSFSFSSAIKKPPVLTNRRKKARAKSPSSFSEIEPGSAHRKHSCSVFQPPTSRHIRCFHAITSLC